jgi:hypothetical protein
MQKWISLRNSPEFRLLGPNRVPGILAISDAFSRHFLFLLMNSTTARATGSSTVAAENMIEL